MCATPPEHSHYCDVIRAETLGSADWLLHNLHLVKSVSFYLEQLHWHGDLNLCNFFGYPV